MMLRIFCFFFAFADTALMLRARAFHEAARRKLTSWWSPSSPSYLSWKFHCGSSALELPSPSTEPTEGGGESPLPPQTVGALTLAAVVRLGARHVLGQRAPQHLVRLGVHTGHPPHLARAAMLALAVDGPSPRRLGLGSPRPYGSHHERPGRLCRGPAWYRRPGGCTAAAPQPPCGVPLTPPRAPVPITRPV